MTLTLIEYRGDLLYNADVKNKQEKRRMTSVEICKLEAEI